MSLEAVQFGDEWGPWHAVRPNEDGTPSDRTFCGRNAITAKRMWEQWTDHPDRCRRCAAAASKNPAGR